MREGRGLNYPRTASQRSHRSKSFAPGRRRTAPPHRIAGRLCCSGQRWVLCASSMGVRGSAQRRTTPLLHKRVQTTGAAAGQEQTYLDASDLFFVLIIASLAVPDRQRPMRDMLAQSFFAARSSSKLRNPGWVALMCTRASRERKTQNLAWVS